MVLSESVKGRNSQEIAVHDRGFANGFSSKRKFAGEFHRLPHNRGARFQ